MSILDTEEPSFAEDWKSIWLNTIGKDIVEKCLTRHNKEFISKSHPFGNYRVLVNFETYTWLSENLLNNHFEKVEDKYVMRIP